MPRVWLDDEFHSHPKVIGAGLEAAGLFARALSYCGAYLTDGFVPGEWVAIVAAKHKKAPEKLIEVGLWKREKGGYSIPDYLDYNDSKEAVLRYRAERSRSGQKGARRRWGGGKEQKPLFDEDDNSDSESHSSSHGESHSNSDSSRARAQGDGSAMARDRAASTTTNTTPLTAEDRDLPADRSETSRASGLPVEKERLATELLSVIGDDADEGTPAVLRSYAAALPEGVLAKVLESVRSGKAEDRAAYAVAALKDELESRQPERSGSERLRADPDAYVRRLVESGAPLEAIEEGIAGLPVEEDERIRLGDLAANLAREEASETNAV